MLPLKITSPSGKLVAWAQESIYHHTYHTVYITDIGDENIPIAFIINNDIYELPLPASIHNMIDFNKYVEDLLWLRKEINSYSDEEN